jgi:trehalose 6-phosphate phosphatase
MSTGFANRLVVDEISLFIDIDGTLLDIAERPDAVVVPRDLIATLDSVHDALDGALAVVSGRRIEDIDRLLAPLKLPASGVHGAQLRVARGAPILDCGSPEIPRAIARAVYALAAVHPGALIEDKGAALAVHWRACMERKEAILGDLERVLESSSAGGLDILRGHCVFEIKSSATSKGDAVRALMQNPPYAARRPVFIGDDTTDIAGFAAAKALGGHAFAVTQLLAGADDFFLSPHDVRAWLGTLAAAPLGLRA